MPVPWCDSNFAETMHRQQPSKRSPAHCTATSGRPSIVSFVDRTGLAPGHSHKFTLTACNAKNSTGATTTNPERHDQL